jgi:hypothetical protein
LRRLLPELSYWFGVTGDDVDRMPYGELDEYVTRLSNLPPVGWVFMGAPKE